MLEKLYTGLFLSIIQRYGLRTELNFNYFTLKHIIKREYGKSSSVYTRPNNILSPIDEELKEIFKFKDTKVSNWIIEVFIL